MMNVHSPNRRVPLAWCLSLGLLFHATARADIFLFDFGNDDSNRGVSVPAPDGNGNYWNSIRAGLFFTDLVAIDGSATTVDFGFTTGGGTDFYNGPSGTNQNPSLSVYDASALGNLGVDEAVYDWYNSSTFQIQQLDPNQTYDLTFFGSRQYPLGDTVTRYTAYTDGTFTTPIAFVDLTVGAGFVGHNQDQVAELTGLAPQGPNHVLYIGFDGATGGTGYLNALQVATTVPEPATITLLLAGSLALLHRKRTGSTKHAGEIDD